MILAAALLGSALPSEAAETEVFVELYLHPLKTAPARAGDVAGFLSEDNAIVLRQHLLGTQPLVASVVHLVLADEPVDSPVPCLPEPGADLPPTRARVLLAREAPGIVISGSVIMHLPGSSIPYLRSFLVKFPAEGRYIYCVRGMLFPDSDRILEALALLYIVPAGNRRVTGHKQTPPLPLEYKKSCAR